MTLDRIGRLGAAIGLVAITLLDLLGSDDITTAAAWMPEIGFVMASVPALMVLTYLTFHGTRVLQPNPPRSRRNEGDSH
ncbi:MAG: hypothetical protein ABGY10_03960 [bacterium]|jgi:hypothetical protein|nr:hypothetical protein [Gemmatimonadota bacterium]HIL89771.1 hypothetical protein [Gemmatimonadota bacterium]